jgi:gluconokinase
MKAHTILIGGICLTGKTSLARKLVSTVLSDAAFIEGDELHTEASITAMALGQPLADEDRILWKERIGALIQNRKAGELKLVTCSALSRGFRDDLRAYGEVRFIFLTFARESAELRAKKRLRDDWEQLQHNPAHTPHYFQPAIYPELLDGQYRDLQVPGAEGTPGDPETDCLVIDLDQFPTGPWGPEADNDMLAREVSQWLFSS